MATMYWRELDGETLTFSIDDEGAIRDNKTNSRWNIFGIATDGELEGSRLEQEFPATQFWFAWVAFVPDSPIYGQDD